MMFEEFVEGPKGIFDRLSRIESTVRALEPASVSARRRAIEAAERDAELVDRALRSMNVDCETGPLIVTLSARLAIVRGELGRMRRDLDGNASPAMN